MILWRISNHASLDGGGGLRAAGRWHSRGRLIVYCALHPASALLEILVHLEVEVSDVPRTYRLMAIEAPDTTSAERIDAGDLPANWPEQPEITRSIGDAWLAERRSALLFVPSALVPETENVLLNPLHADAIRLRIASVREHAFDPRLL